MSSTFERRRALAAAMSETLYCHDFLELLQVREWPYAFPCAATYIAVCGDMYFRVRRHSFWCVVICISVCGDIHFRVWRPALDLCIPLVRDSICIPRMRRPCDLCISVSCAL